MKRFIIRIVLFVLLPVGLSAAVCEFCLRRIPNDYSYKNEWLTNYASFIKILSLGSSHGFYGIESNCFSENAFNAAHVSQSIKYDHFIFSKFFDEMDSLKILILPISYFSMFGSGPENGIEDWRTKYYSIYYGCKYHRFEPKYNLETYNGLHLKNVKYSILGKADHRTCNDLGKGTTYALENRAENWEESGSIAAKRHTKTKIDTVILAKNKMMVEEMINKCGQKNVFVVILTTPTYHTYRENLNRKQLDLMIEYCESFEKQYDNVYYLNLLADDRFQSDDFFDADHLNEFGALKLSRILQQTIDSLQICEKRVQNRDNLQLLSRY